ncbi:MULTISPECIES: type II toxin-antitoxin system VapB family antitoxin [unclassified Amycolatopsis]|uniref:type II toxin-antitoxin system VapB family antitoxin n=1 Tax=unclassified Amycolatopsis TaxID=2618356 RepID=UPI002E0EF1C6|nr:MULTISPECIES: type II toxin-antitoxin system VapB family antitoxin [unclassified Amycolatopsis]WSJ81584.1 type II toxin-antitoxin system VapB family antitoxin [Amycolatopsis sp. NBC_01307]WSK75034.1 type II toxin-antitoxin system VapB family antitoxin [Amycolatopsis sp. NBC_01286]
MAMNIKDPEAERLAAEVAALTGDTKTGAVREALRLRRDQLMARDNTELRLKRMRRVLEEEIWPLIPPEELGKPIPKDEWEEILGFGPGGV